MELTSDRMALTEGLAAWRLHERIDDARRVQGKLLQAFGYGPQTHPSRRALAGRGFALEAYGGATGPAVLAVPAPIKRPYIWDLRPGASVIGQFLRGGLRPYLVQWEEPDADFGLADYVRSLAGCIDAMRAETGDERVFLVGHSLGGLFAAIGAALYPERLRGVVVVAAPLHFDYDPSVGLLGPVVAEFSRSPLFREMPGNLPGSLLSAASFRASPDTFGRDRWLDWMRSAAEPGALRTHLQVERWSLDEMPLARQLVVDLVEELYGRDAFLRGTLEIDGRVAAAERLETPLVVVADRRCAIVPPPATIPLIERSAARDKRLLWYEGDVGVALQHVGVLIGAQAQARVWPEILAWMHRVAAG
jgi:poly[(R)-3-hydroxyalkanoate] polymerase subunit PhaC